MNNCILTGRLTRDPEIRRTQTGKAVCNFTLAVDRRKNEGADFISCVAWEKVADLLERYCAKGSKIGISGQLNVRQYEDRNGEKRNAVEVIVNDLEFLDAKKKDAPAADYPVDASDEVLPF